MSLNAYTAGLTCAQIAAQCEALAGNPGLHLNPTTLVAPTTPTLFAETPAYVALNEILTGLYTQYEWPFLDTAANITVASRENALPTDFWRCRFENPLMVLDGGSRYVLDQLDPATFFHAGLSTQSVTGRPTCFTIDKNRSSYFVDATPDKTYNGELHYTKYLARLTATTEVPMFPHPDLIVQKLLVWYYQHQDDNRWQAAAANVQDMMTRIRASAYEDRDSSAQIPLDGHWFLRMPSDPDRNGWA